MQHAAHPRICVLCSLSDLADPAGEVLQAVSCHIEGLDWVRRELLGVDCEHVGPRTLPILHHHWTDEKVDGRKEGEKERDGQRQGDTTSFVIQVICCCYRDYLLQRYTVTELTAGC